MKNQSDTPRKNAVTTPKKIALVVLGALTLLTFVNLIQGAVHKYKDRDHSAFHVEEDIVFHVEEDENVEVHEDNRFVFRINSSKHTAAGELMIEESYKVSAGEYLSVAVGDADISIDTHQGNSADIKVFLDGRDMDKARAYFEDQRFEVTQEGSTVYVKTNPERNNYGWNRDGGAQIRVEVNIPKEFNVDLKTSDGDIALGELNGEASLQSSDGDIETALLSGPAINIRTSDGDITTHSISAEKTTIATSDGDITLNDVDADDISVRTSDGDIKLGRLTGNSTISTSDGDIVIKAFEGREIAVRTSDGEIMAEKVIADHSQFQTSDGSIMLKSVAGELTAKTASGDLNVVLTTGNKVYLRTGDGDIYISAPRGYAAELFLKGDNVRVASGFKFDGKLKEKEAEGRINGGGPTIEARTSDGEIVFREN